MTTAAWTERDVRTVDAVERNDPDVERLATYLAPACWIDRALLRRLRTEFFPTRGPDLEADLWFSPLIRHRNPDAVQFSAGIGALLRDRLADAARIDPEQVRSVRREMDDEHAALSPILRTEEDLAWTLVEGDGARVQELFANAIAARATDPELARTWFARMQTRLPDAAVRSGLAELGAEVQAGTVELVDAAERLDGFDLVAHLPRRRLSVRHDGTHIQISHGLLAGGTVIEVPGLDPIELTVLQDGRETGAEVRIPAGLPGPISIRTYGRGGLRSIDGSEWDLGDEGRPFADVGIVFRQEDRDAALRITAALEAQGIRVWADQTLPPAPSLTTAMEQAVDVLSTWIVVWSDEPGAETPAIERIVERWTEDPPTLMIPVLLGDARPPERLAVLHALRFPVDGRVRRTDPNLDALVRAIAHRATPPAPTRTPTVGLLSADVAADTAADIKRQLADAGLDVWSDGDPGSWLPSSSGRSHEDQIQTWVVVWSRRSVRDDELFSDLAFLRRDPRNDGIRVFPVVIGDAALPSVLADVSSLYVANDDQVTQAVEILIDRIRAQPVVPLAQVWNIRDLRTRQFILAGEALPMLDEQFRQWDQITRTTESLIGVAGVGKTTVARRFALDHRDAFSIGWWIDASSPDAIVDGLATLGVALGLPTISPRDDQARRVITRLELADRPWLLVLDDATSVSEVERWLPTSGPGMVIVTSRNHAFDDGHRIMVGGDEHLATDERVRRLLDAPADADPATATDLAAMYTEVVADAEADAPGSAALMGVLGAFADEPVPRAFLVRSRFGDAPIEALSRRGLIRADERTVAFSHGLIHAIARASTDQASLAAAVEVLGAALGSPEPWSGWIRNTDDAAPHVLAAAASDVVPDQATAAELWRLLEAVAADQLRVGQVERSASAARIARDLATETFGADPERALQSTSALAAAELEAGRSAAAVDLLRQVVDAARRSYPANDPVTLDAEIRLAEAMVRSGRYREAIEQLDDLLRRRAVASDRQGPVRFRAETALAEAELAVGGVRSAVDRLERSVHEQRSAAGADNLDTLRATVVLAGARRLGGDPPGAIDLYREALESYRYVLGPDALTTVRTEVALASTLREAGLSAEAADLLASRLDRLITMLGPDHPEVLDGNDLLARTYLDLHEATNAVDVLERNIPIQRRVLGNHHPAVLAAEGTLFTALAESGRLDAAIDQGRLALRHREAVHGPDHDLSRSLQISLARLYFQVGRTNEGLDLSNAVLAVRVPGIVPDRPTAQLLGDVAEALLSGGRGDEAVLILEELVDAETRRVTSTGATVDWWQTLLDQALQATGGSAIAPEDEPPLPPSSES